MDLDKVDNKSLKQILYIFLIFSLFLSSFISISADQWLSHYKDESFSLSEDYGWSLVLGRPPGTQFYMYIGLNRLVDIFIVDEDNVNKYVGEESFESLSNYTFIGVSAKTIYFTSPIGSYYYLIIDNSDLYGTASQGDVIGNVIVNYLKVDNNNNDNDFWIYFIIFLLLIVGITSLIIVAVNKIQKEVNKKVDNSKFYHCFKCGSMIPVGEAICQKCGAAQ